MPYQNLLEDLHLPRELIPDLLDRQRRLEEFMPLIRGMTVPETAGQAYASLAQALGEDHLTMLACHLYAAASMREVWARQGIPDEIYLATMGCFSRFLGETRVRTGVLAFDRAWWTIRQLRMTLFRIGTLEFELLPEDALQEYPGLPATRAISLHIPSDASITETNVTESLAAGRAFVRKFFPEYGDCPMGCNSWLLSRELGKLLPEDSRILSFQRRFTILLEEQPEEEDCLEWLFRVPEGTSLPELPEDTSLQRRVKAHLLSGGRIGTAIGLLREN